MPTRIVTVSELKVKLGTLMAELEVQGIPLYVTQYGKPKAVLTRYDEYEALLLLPLQSGIYLPGRHDPGSEL